jgi:hypothetical protein
VLLPQIAQTPDDLIAVAVAVFQKKRWEKKGRAPKGGTHSTSTERARAVKGLLLQLNVSTAATATPGGKADGFEGQLRAKRREHAKLTDFLLGK